MRKIWQSLVKANFNSSEILKILLIFFSENDRKWFTTQQWTILNFIRWVEQTEENDKNNILEKYKNRVIKYPWRNSINPAEIGLSIRDIKYIYITKTISNKMIASEVNKKESLQHEALGKGSIGMHVYSELTSKLWIRKTT